MKKVDNKTIKVLSESMYMTIIAKYGLSDAKKIVKLIQQKLKDESKRRKNEKI